MTDAFVTRATTWGFRIAAWAFVAWLVGWQPVAVMVAAALATQAVARVAGALGTGLASRALVVMAVVAHLLLFGAALAPDTWHIVVPIGAGVFMCHAVAYLVDVHRGAADPRRAGAALLYMVQLPVFPAGPLSRFHEFSEQLSRADISMGGFAYGVRRIVTGLIKVFLIAGPLASTADRIFALRVTRLATDTAWLGALCVALDVYFTMSGFSDIGIGLGRVLGFRHPENFRRPYTADSIREFWRRWNVTLITWLRDYLQLPIAGHDRATPALYLLTIAGFLVVGLWHRATLQVLPWAVYFGSWLAVEALGLGAALARLPRVVRHAYVTVVVLVGWVLLRASGPGPLLGYLEAMAGSAIVPFPGAGIYLTLPVVTALVSAIVFAGPLVSSISRWRVSVDAATASLLMMLAATAVFVWRSSLPVLRVFMPEHGRGGGKAAR